MLYLQDHSERSPNNVDNVADIDGINSINLGAVMQIADSLRLATHGVIHVDNDELDELVEEWSDEAESDLILLRISYGDKAGLAEKAHYKIITSDHQQARSLYILNARNDSALCSEIVVQFGQLSISDAARVCEGDLTSLTPSIQRLFSRAFMPFIVALDILCQGFEIAHRDAGAGAEVFKEKWLKKTESEEWWMSCLNVSSLEELRQHLSAERVRDDLVEKIEAGFIRARSMATLKSGVGCVCNAVKEALE